MKIQASLLNQVKHVLVSQWFFYGVTVKLLVFTQILCELYLKFLRNSLEEKKQSMKHNSYSTYVLY